MLGDISAAPECPVGMLLLALNFFSGVSRCLTATLTMALAGKVGVSLAVVVFQLNLPATHREDVVRALGSLNKHIRIC